MFGTTSLLNSTSPLYSSRLYKFYPRIYQPLSFFKSSAFKMKIEVGYILRTFVNTTMYPHPA
jgi:hypothetical protein